MEHYLNICDIRGGEITPVDVLTFGSPCFVAGTKVITDQGYKNIEDIRVGDKVLTHKNRFRPVVNIGGNNDKETYLLKAQGILPTRVTGNHPYYTRKMKYKWDEEIKKNVRVFSKPDWKMVDSLEENDFIGIAIPQIEENPLNITEEECWLIGRYIADGHLRNTKRSDSKNSYHHSVIYTVGNAKIDEFKRHLDKYHASTQAHTESTYRCTISSFHLCNLIQTIGCGQGATNKTFPEALLNLPTPLAKAVLEGYMSGDGCFTQSNFSATSVSQVLVMSLQRLVAKIYKTPTRLYKIPVPPTTVIEGRTVNQNTQYQARFKKEISTLCKAHVDGDYIWYPFRSAEKKKIADVFNLEVEEDNSYTANNAIVHNCQGLSLAGARKGLEDIRSNLFFQAIRVLKEMREATNGNYPKYAIWENVPGAFSTNKGKDFAEVLNQFVSLAEQEAPSVSVPNKGWPTAGTLKDVDGGWSIAWRVADAQHWGVPQRRRRIFLVMDFGGDNASQVLFKCESLSRDSQESGAQGEHTPSPTQSCPRGTNSEGGSDLPIALHLTQDPIANTEATPCLGCGSKTGQATVGVCCFDNVSSTLRAGAGAPKHEADFKGRLVAEATVPAICIQGSMIGRADQNGPQGSGVNEDVSFTLNTTDRHAVCCTQGPNLHPDIMVMGSSQSNAAIENNISPTLMATMGTGGGNVPCIVPIPEGQTVGCVQLSGFQNYKTTPENEAGATIRAAGGDLCGGSENMVITSDLSLFENNRSDCRYRGPLEIAPTICAKYGTGGCNTPFVVLDDGVTMIDPSTLRIRRLTPTECARLQGFPSWWGKIEPIEDMSDDDYEFWKKAIIEASLIEGKLIWDEEANQYVSPKGKPHKHKTKEQMIKWYNKLHSDAPEYKMWGNGVALPCVREPLHNMAALGAKTLGSLFDGSGGFPLAGILEGITPLWSSEIALYPISVTRQNFKDLESLRQKLENPSQLAPSENIVTYQKKIGTLCARDYKGVSGEYASSGKLVLTNQNL